MNPGARLRVWSFFLSISTGTHISVPLLFPSKIILRSQACSHKPHGNIFHLFICSVDPFSPLTAQWEAAQWVNQVVVCNSTEVDSLLGSQVSWRCLPDAPVCFSFFAVTAHICVRTLAPYLEPGNSSGSLEMVCTYLRLSAALKCQSWLQSTWFSLSFQIPIESGWFLVLAPVHKAAACYDAFPGSHCWGTPYSCPAAGPTPSCTGAWLEVAFCYTHLS